MKEKPTTWLITGISSGIGKALAQAVLDRGDIVIGTVRKPELIAEFSAIAPGRAFAHQIDLLDRDAVRPVISHAIEATGGVDVVVNCAGYGLAGAAEEVTDKEMRDQLEANFFGAVAVTQAALPFMRKQRRGHFINVTSTAGALGYPGLSLYCASKFALEGFSDGLAMEVAHLGIKVTIIEPSGFRTNFSSATGHAFAKEIIPDYDSTSGKIRRGLLRHDGNQRGDPAKAAQAIMAVVNSPKPPMRLGLGEHAVSGIREKLNHWLTEIVEWQGVSLNTDLNEYSHD